MIKKQLQHKENTTHLYPEKEIKTNSEQSNQNYCNFQNKDKTASAQNIDKLYKNANLTKF